MTHSYTVQRRYTYTNYSMYMLSTKKQTKTSREMHNYKFREIKTGLKKHSWLSHNMQI